MIKFQQVAIAFVGSVSLLACTMSEGGSEGSADATTSDQEISGGAPLGGGAGAVVISTRGDGTCTGAAISPYVVITAAHCFDRAMGSARDGAIETKITYTKDGSNYRCVNGTGAPGCDDYETAIVSRYSAINHPDTAGDFAILLIPGSGLSSFVDIVGLSPAAFESLVTSFYGSGMTSTTSGSGPMRRFEDSIDWVGPSHFIVNAGKYRICLGDSGGPALFDDSWVLGVMSNMLSSDGVCAAKGAKMRWKKIRVSDIDYINSLLTNWDPGGPRCRLVAADRYWCAE